MPAAILGPLTSPPPSHFYGFSKKHMISSLKPQKAIWHTVYDRIDAAATINFSTQFGAATIRERRLFESGIYFIRRSAGSKNSVKSEHKHKDSVLVLLRA